MLEVRGLKKSFGRRLVLEEMDFTIRDGEFLSILGASGCGKTTLLRILIGLETPDAGRIVLDGRDITTYPPDRRGMGIVFQNYALFENMTVLGNVEYALKIRPETRASAREKAMRALEAVSLAGRIDRYPHELSGGEAQRVAVARTLALAPEIILLDEPMSALDAETRLSLREELKSLQKRLHSTMVLITHDQEEAFAMSDRIMVVNAGRIEQLDTPSEIIAHPANDFVRSFVVENINRKIASLMPFAGGK